MAEVDPIRDIQDVRAVYRFLNKGGHFKVAHLWRIGCNCALRYSDLSRLKVADIEPGERNGQRVGYYHEAGGRGLTEQKTKKKRALVLNSVAMDSIDWLRNAYPDDEYLFQSEGNRVGSAVKPLSRQYVSARMKEAQECLMLSENLNTHSMRKTFGYHAYAMGKGVPIEFLQRLFNHSSPRVTLTYIGVTADTVKDIYVDHPIDIR